MSYETGRKFLNSYNDLKEKVKDQAALIKELKNAREDQEAEHQKVVLAFKRENQALRNENEALKRENKSLERENELLREKIAEMSKEQLQTKLKWAGGGAAAGSAITFIGLAAILAGN